MARAKTLLDRCKKSLDVAQKMIENDRDFSEDFIEIESDSEFARNIVEEVNRYFAQDAEAKNVEAPRLAQAGSDL